MSLLMDALKRAETSKQEAARKPPGTGGSDPPPDNALALQPIDDMDLQRGGNPLPDLALHLDAVDADLAEAAAPPLPKQFPNADKKSAVSDRLAVQNAFSAKQSVTTLTQRPLWLAIGVVTLSGAAIGAYFWYQLNVVNSGILTQPPPTVSLHSKANPSSSPTSASGDNTYTQATLPLFPEPNNIANAPQPLSNTPPNPAPQSTRVNDEPPPSSIRLTRIKPEADAGLLHGQARLLRNELDLARQDFEQTLNRDPNNSDAMLALAAIAERQGRPADAIQLYQQAWVANPSEPSVQAAILNSAAAGSDVQNTESRLKTSLARQPESAPLNFSLGNLYARQGRWPEAQQAYFSAVASDGDNPDYLFNLAVSLDHIRQTRAAAQHYRLALEASERRPAGFNQEQVKKRLTDLTTLMSP